MKTIFEVNDLRRLRLCVRKSLAELGITVPKLSKSNSARKSKRLQNKNKEKIQGTSCIFGVPLSDVPSEFIEDCGYVPHFLVDAIVFIDAKVDTVGIFRRTGSVQRQKELKQIIENGDSVKCAKLVDDVANLVKQFLRELPESLITSSLDGHFMKALEIDDEPNKLRAILYLCLLLPLDHLATLRYFVLHLSRIVTRSHVNKMDCTNLALVITPNIIGSCNDKSLHRNERHLSVQTALVELLIQNAASIGIVSSELEVRLASEAEPAFEASDNEASFDKTQKKKRRSGSLQGMMNSIEQNLRSWRSSSSKKTSIDGACTNRPEMMTTASQPNLSSAASEAKTPVLRKRKADEDSLGLSKKKMRTIVKGLPHQSLLGGPSFDIASLSMSFKGHVAIPSTASTSETSNREKDSANHAYTSSSSHETVGSKKRFPSPFRGKGHSPKVLHSGKKKNKLFRMLSVNHDHAKAKRLRELVTRKHHKTNSLRDRVLDGSQLTKEAPPSDVETLDRKDVYIIDDKIDILSLAKNLEFDLYDQASMGSPNMSLEHCAGGTGMHSRTSMRSQAEQGTPTKSTLKRGRPNTPTNGLHPSLRKKYCHDDSPIANVDSKTIDERSSHVEVIVYNALVDSTNTAWSASATTGQNETTHL